MLPPVEVCFPAEVGLLLIGKSPSSWKQMVVPKIGGPQYRSQNTIVLVMGTPKMVPVILGNPKSTLRLGSKSQTRKQSFEVDL